MATGEFVGNPQPSPERNSQTGGASGADESAGAGDSALVKGSGGNIPAEMIALQV